MIRDVDLVAYLPPFLADYKETNITFAAENPEFELVWKTANQILKNGFIATADEYGIARFEKILQILPECSDNLDNRRMKVWNRWFNAVPYTIRMLAEKMTTLLGDARCFSIWTDIEKAYELQLTIYSTEDIMFSSIHIKEAQYLLENMVPLNIHYGINEKMLLDISVDNMEQIALRNVHFKMGISFWCQYVFDGSWILNGSVILNNQRRYGLMLGVKVKQEVFHTLGRIKICSVRFGKAKVNTSEIVSARAVFRSGIDFWNINYCDESCLPDESVLSKRYGLSLGISHKLLIAGCTEDIGMRKLAVRWEQYTRESMAANARNHLSVKPLAEHKQEKMAIMVHSEIEFSEQETVENITVETKNKNHWFFNGEFLLDGTKNLNSIYKKEAI